MSSAASAQREEKRESTDANLHARRWSLRVRSNILTSRILTIWLRVFPTEVSDEQRLPAYSGATVPDLHRLPLADVL